MANYLAQDGLFCCRNNIGNLMLFSHLIIEIWILILTRNTLLKPLDKVEEKGSVTNRWNGIVGNEAVELLVLIYVIIENYYY